jgi:RNA polymerase-binding transcription factor DksA
MASKTKTAAASEKDIKKTAKDVKSPAKSVPEPVKKPVSTKNQASKAVVKQEKNTTKTEEIKKNAQPQSKKSASKPVPTAVEIKPAPKPETKVKESAKVTASKNTKAAPPVIAEQAKPAKIIAKAAKEENSKVKPKTETKAETKAETKPTAKKKPEPKVESKPELKAEVKTEVEPKAKTAATKIVSKPKPEKSVVDKIPPTEPKSPVKPSAKKKETKSSKAKAELANEDIPVQIHPNVRYSDEDLEMFETRIQELRHEALDELRMLRERLEDLTNYDFAEESMIYSMHMAEQGSEAMEKEKTYAQIQRINEYIKKLDDALLRIKDKTFGICRVCGCLIAKERLLAVPITTLSASYKIHKRCPEDGIDRIEPLGNGGK